MKFKEAENIILNFFSESKVRNATPVWERMKDGKNWKWVLTIHNLNWGDTIIIFTKIILKTDESKTNLILNQFSYLYDLNCNYHFINFKDMSTLKNKLTSIIFNNKFGNDIKSLSTFIENPTMQLNNELAKQKITNYTVYDIDYSPKVSVTPCKISTFDFKFDINNVHQIELNIKKENTQHYIFQFKFKSDVDTYKVKNLTSIERSVIKYIKYKIKTAE